MSFLFGTTKNLGPQGAMPLGLSQRSVNSTQQAQPVPYFCGKARLGLTWISNLFNWWTSPASSDSGKGGGTKQSNYFASIAGLACHGPVDCIWAVYLNQDLVWGVDGALSGYTTFNIGAKRIDHPDYVDLHLVYSANGQTTDYGIMRLYWGTETQTVDPKLAALAPTKVHPPYRGFCYAVFKDFLLGENQTSMQNVELVLGRFPQSASNWEQGVRSNIHQECNPASFIYDLATHPRAGIRVTDSFFDLAVLKSTFDRLNTEAFGFSPYLKDQSSVKDTLMTACEYFDGYPAMTDAGQLALQLVRPPAPSPTLPTIDVTLMTARPTFIPQDWSLVNTDTSVQFTNQYLDLQADAVTWRDHAAERINPSVNLQTVDRTWLTIKEKAQQVAATLGQASALPQISGKVSLRKTGTLYDDLAPGNLFKFNYADRNVNALLWRVVDRTQDDPAKPEFKISFQADYSFLYPGQLSYAEVRGSSEGTPEPPAASYRILELPLALCPDGKLSLAILSPQPDPSATGFNVFLARYENGAWLDSYVQINTVRSFAVYGTLQSDYPATQPVLDETTGLIINLSADDSDLGEQTLFNALANDLLAFVGNEIFSIAGANVISPGVYQLLVVRGRFATPIESHTAGDDVYIISQSSLQPIQHPQFQVNNTSRFKLQYFTAQGIGDLSLVTSTDYLTTGFIYKQTPPTNLQLNGSTAPSYSHGQNVTITWTLTEAGADFHEPELYTTTILLEFVNGSGTVVGSQEVAAGISSLALTNAALVALLGGSEISFTLRASTKIVNTWFIATSKPISIEVTKL